MEPPKPDKPLKPATRARAEDAFTVLARDGGMSKEDARNFRDAFRKIMDPKSDWFVHPTAIGPSLSLNVANGREEAGKIWGQMANHLQFACVFSLLACVRIGVDPPVELVRALDGVRKIMEKTGSAGADQARELHTLIADRSESRANPS